MHYLDEIAENLVLEHHYYPYPELSLEQLYIVTLSHQTLPYNEWTVKEYCGTLDEIGELIAALDANITLRAEYASIIAAWETYQAGDVDAYYNAGGSKQYLITPVRTLAMSSCCIEDPAWYYRDKFGCLLLGGADETYIEQRLVDDGDRYLIMARYRFAELRYVHSVEGWIPHDGNSRGFPGLLKMRNDGVVETMLYTLVATYYMEDNAIRDMADPDKFDFQQISRDLFSGC